MTVFISATIRPNPDPHYLSANLHHYFLKIHFNNTLGPLSGLTRYLFTLGI
jgi:hypothetical protein